MNCQDTSCKVCRRKKVRHNLGQLQSCCMYLQLFIIDCKVNEITPSSNNTYHTTFKMMVIFRNDDDLYTSRTLTVFFLFAQATTSVADWCLTSSNNSWGNGSLLNFVILFTIDSAFLNFLCKRHQRKDSGMALVKIKVIITNR